jgi:hypothetical protein
MPLNPSGLTTQLTGNFATPGPDYASCGQQWATAVQNYAAAIVPASTAVAAAATTLAGALASAFALPNALPSMDSAFTAFAVTVGAGMAPAFVAVPPPSPINFASIFGVTRLTHADAASAISTLIDSWMRTGTATPSGGGAPVPWS